MGILNVTPDSFYDGGIYTDEKKVENKVKEMINNGVDIIDIGAESSRPGSVSIDAKEEIQRLKPVVSQIRSFSNIPISIDSTKSEVIQTLLPYDIQIINDISAGKDENIILLASKYNLYICIMHMQNRPENMQDNPTYKNVTNEIYDYLRDKIKLCIDLGISQEKIIIDPGFGFGKTLDHNYTIMKKIENFKAGYGVGAKIATIATSGAIAILAIGNPEAVLGIFFAMIIVPPARIAGGTLNGLINMSRAAYEIHNTDLYKIDNDNWRIKFPDDSKKGFQKFYQSLMRK